MKRPAWLPATVLVATHNPGKLQEWRTLLGALDVEVRAAQDLELPEPEETAATYLGNARLKARAAAGHTGLPTLADDTGFEADALGGAPGVRTARWAQANGGYPHALEALVKHAGAGTRARLVCAVAFVGGATAREAQATVEGSIRAVPGEGPGFAAILEPDDGRALLVDGVLTHRRAAFERLTSR